MVDISSQEKKINIKIQSGGIQANVGVTQDTAQYYSEKSREWATSNRIVDGVDYSSKYYAEKSKESEAKAENYERSVIEKYNSFIDVSNQAEAELQTLKDDSISQINTVASSGISDIANKTSEAITNLNTNIETATSEINNVKNSAVTQLSKEAQEQLKNIESTGFYMRDDKLYFINSKGEEEEFKSGGGAGAVMFDTKISDHILEGEEAKGWALQGTYVSGALYPDFYSKCLEEYKNSSKSWNGSNVSLVGSVVDNKGVLSGFASGAYALMPSYFTGSLTSFEIVVCVTISGIGTQQSIIANSTTNQATVQLQLLSGGQLELLASSVGSTSWDVSLKTINSVTEGEKYWVKVLFNTTTGYELYLSQDGLTYEPQATNATVKLPKWTEVMAIGNDTPYNSPYWRGSIDLKETYIDVNGSRYWSGANTIAQNSNGHKFYPIAEKSAIDSVYNQYGIADFYGIDEENERVFLPRNKYFQQLTDDVSKVNDRMDAGSPNITGTIAIASGYGTVNGAFKRENSYSGNGINNHTNWDVSFDASRSSSIYGNSDTVQPPSSLKLLYYCVGNTVVNESEIDVSKVLDEAVLKSSLEEVQVVVETYQNGTSWYKVYSDGWCEQGGFSSVSNNGTITFLKSFKDINYTITLGNCAEGNYYCGIKNKTTTGITVYSSHNSLIYLHWQACGYIK